jgi:beta-galactosidase
MKRTGRIVLPAIVLAVGLGAADLSAAAAPPASVKDFFPVSVWYAGGKARAPMLEKVTADSARLWKKDLDQIKALGFNTVRTWVEWTNCEPEEGKYDFSALKLIVDLAEQAGLRVLVQVYIDSAPDWVGRKYPDSKFVASNGLSVESQAAPGFCFDHPGVRQKILRFFAEAARAVKGKPAFLGWDLWSEPHIINWAEINHLGNPEYIQFCYCDSSRARFREWLKAKYGTLQNLNAAWCRTFENWDEVDPPRFGTILTYTDYIDWKNYISDKLAEDLAMKSAAVKAVVPAGVTTSHSAGPGLFSRPAWNGTPDDRKMAGAVDYYGVSLYPKHAWTTRPWPPFYRAAGNDFVRSMNLRNGGFYVGELQAGYGVFGMKLSVPVVGADLRDWMWSVIAYGARAVNIYAYYPMSSGYEAGGYGLVELDGQVTERAVEAGKVARVITENMELFLKARPPQAQVAILYNPLEHMVGGQQTFTGEGQAVGSNNLSESLQGVHRAFAERHIPVDFLHTLDLGPESLSRYRLLIVPYPVMMSAADIKKLIAYVEGGGTLVVEARCGWIDERGFSADVIPGGGLHQVLGCRESSVKPITKPGAMIVKSASEALPLLKPGDKLDTLFFEEGFDLLGGKGRVVAEFEDGRPAAVYAAHGKGKAIIVGSFLGSAYYHFHNPNNGRFFAGLCDWLNLSRPVEVKAAEKDAFVEARLLIGEKRRLLFAFNRSEKRTAVEFSVADGGEDVEASDLETGEKIPSARRAGRLVLTRIMEPAGLWVVVLEERQAAGG